MTLFQRNDPPPEPVLSVDDLLKRLDSIIAAAEGVDQLISTLWTVEPTVRTPRMAEIVSLLSRAQSKMKIERKHHQKRQENAG